MSEQVSLAIIAICMLVVTVSIVVVAIVLTIVVLRANKSINTLTKRVQPLIAQANETAKTANGVVQVVKTRTEEIMNTAENTVDTVARKVKITTDIVQESISPPLITVASVMTGVSRGLEVLSQMRGKGGDGHAR